MQERACHCPVPNRNLNQYKIFCHCFEDFLYPLKACVMFNDYEMRSSEIRDQNITNGCLSLFLAE